MITEDELNLMLLDAPDAFACDCAHSQYGRVARLIEELERVKATLPSNDAALKTAIEALEKISDRNMYPRGWRNDIRQVAWMRTIARHALDRIRG